MLGLCWTPAAVQGMQKVASTMPSNPEQLLGAILVRKDIFQRFETTMHDTCLDANNLLEYLFSLYNSTAAPSERENFPTSQSLSFMRRDPNHNRKSSGRGQQMFSHQSNVGNVQLPPPSVQGRLTDSSRAYQPGFLEGHRKKVKLDQSNFQGNVNYTSQHQNFSQSVCVKPYDSHPIFPGASNNNPSTNVKMELTPDIESHHGHSSSPLPPFSQIRRQGSRPYSPASAQYAAILTTPLHEEGHPNIGVAVDHITAKGETESIMTGALEPQHLLKENQSSSTKTSKKHRMKASGAAGSNGTTGERTGRKKRNHQCFCGALFTRADNLKRHIRKSHEEKLGKLSSAPLNFEMDNSEAPVGDFSQAFPATGQEALNSGQSPDVQDPQKKEAQPQQQQLPQQQQDDHHHHHQQQQAEEEEVIKSAPGVKWSCFCGESFDDHRQLIEHSRTHKSST